jgi:hypothetical protein
MSKKSVIEFYEAVSLTELRIKNKTRNLHDQATDGNNWNENLLTYLLTELSPSCEATNCAVTQELPSILWNPQFHYRVHKSPPLVSILSQIEPVHTIPSYLSKIYFNIVRPPTGMRTLRKIVGKTRSGPIRSQDIRRRCSVQEIGELTTRSRDEWNKHVTRMAPERIVRSCKGLLSCR